MKTVFIVYWYDSKDKIDFEAAFDGDILVDAWNTNDAIWHGEYYDSFLEKMGLKIEYREPTDLDKEQIKKHFGIE